MHNKLLKAEDLIPYLRKDQIVQSLMNEINRWLYLGEDYSVDSERAKALIRVLRRADEVARE